MKCLKEPLLPLANRQDKVLGTFFEGRFKSVAVLDEKALLAIGVYIDLNPVAVRSWRLRKQPITHRSSSEWTMSKLKA
jgi:hypothetical protein